MSFDLYFAPPTILGPVSACNTTIWLDHLVAGVDGVQALVYVNSILRAQVPVTAARMEIEVGTLISGDVIQAEQAGGGRTPVTEWVVVGEAPTSAQVGYPVVRAHTYDCALGIEVEGLHAGAIAFAYDDNNTLLGFANAVAGKAVISFSQIAKGFVSVNQSVCGGLHQLARIGPSLSVTLDANYPPVLPYPDIVGPLRQGQTMVHLDKLYPGAVLYLSVNNQWGALVVAIAHSQWVQVAPLQAGDVVQARQFFANCSDGEWSPPKVVVAMAAPAPKVMSSVCAGADRVEVENLIPGALVAVVFFEHNRFSGNLTGAVVYLCVSTDSTCTVQIPSGVPSATDGLNVYDSVSVYQTLSWDSSAQSAMWSPPSDLQLIAPLGPTISAPSITGPIHAGGTTIAVRNITPGTTVVIEAQNETSPPVWFNIGSASASDVVVEVPVNAAFMTTGRACRPVTVSCGEPTFGAAVDVIPARPPPLFYPGPNYEPSVQPILDSGAIHVSNLIAGALVDVFQVSWQIGMASLEGARAKAMPLRPQSSTTRSGPVEVAVLSWLTTVDAPTGVLSIMRPRELVAGTGVVVVQRIDGFTSSQSQQVAVLESLVDVGDVGSVCQLTGPTTTQVVTDGNGVAEENISTDEGLSVEHNGKLHLFFGDAQGSAGKPVFLALGGAPCPRLISPQCPWDDRSRNLGFFSLFAPNPTLFPWHACEPPTGGFSYEDSLYLFVPKAIMPGTCTPTQSHVLVARQQCSGADPMVLGTPNDSTGASPMPSPFSWLYKVDDDASGANLRFINMSAVVINNRDFAPHLPSSTGDGVFIWGTGLYSQSELYLLWAPLQSGQGLPSPANWYLFTGLGPGPAFAPTFAPVDMTQAFPFAAAVPVDSFEINGGPPGAREISVSYAAGLNRWVLIGTGLAMVARHPWGPFEHLTSFLRPNDLGPGTAIRAEGVAVPDTSVTTLGGLYGGYQIERYAGYDSDSDQASIFFVLSLLPLQGVPSDSPCMPSGCTYLVRTVLRPPALMIQEIEHAYESLHVQSIQH